MNIFMTGGTGFIGSYLRTMLLREGHNLTILTRSPENQKENQATNQQFVSWQDDLPEIMNTTDVVINLAGKNLFGVRWTDAVKQELRDSRILTTRKLVESMEKAEDKPSLMISASGINYYKSQGDKIIDESGEPGSDFLANLCIDWEQEALEAEKLGIRTTIARIAPVLERDGGMIDKMKLPFVLFAGGPIGSGDQYVSWIHMKDMCKTLIYPLYDTSFTGPFNASSPSPVTMNEFAKSMGQVMNRPSLFRVPESVLKIMMGEASQPVLGSLRIQPKKLQVSGFEFEFEDLEEALADIL